MTFKNVPFLEKWNGMKDAFTSPLTDAYYRPFLMVSFIMDYYLNRCIVFNKIGDVKNAIKDYIILKKCCADKIPAALQEDLNEVWAKRVSR